MDYYAEELIRLGKQVDKFTNSAVVDAFFAKASFIHKVLSESPLHVICRLRDDAVVRYLYDGPQKANGRRREYGANVNWKTIDKKYFKLVYEDEKVRVWDAKVNYSAFKRTIRVAYVEYLKSNEAKETKETKKNKETKEIKETKEKTKETKENKKTKKSKQSNESDVECYKIYFSTDLNLPAFRIV
ncbi:MAG: hypothetical protein RLZZ628_4296, partial [Bacteroidota bacterium]